MPTTISLMPHAVCWRQDPALIWTMVITNAITFLSYTAICLTLFYLARRTRKVIARDWAYFVVGFALFIVACGSTHLMEVVTTWVPFFWIDAATNIVTALLSGYVAVQFFRRASTIGFGINDFSERLANTESENAQMQESLLQAQKLEAWSQMSATMSHEIAAPLESIQNLLYLIQQADEPVRAKVEYAHKASEEAERVLTIARSTLGFFRQSSTPEKVDLRVAAESVQFVLESTLRHRLQTLDIHSDGDVTVEALPGESRQVLLNLVRNAAEATKEVGAVIHVSLIGAADGVEIVVSDTGSGIDPEVLPRLFDFGMTTKGEQGNGMGLWTVRHILTRHGGSIQVESWPGKGTQFTLWWPRKYASVHKVGRARTPIALVAAQAAEEVFHP